MENKDDHLLIKQFLEKKDMKAFDQLVNKYQDLVFNISCRLLGDYHEAEDCTQDVFIKVYKGIKNFRFQAAFSTWLYRITVNACKNKLNSVYYRFKKKMLSPVSDIQDFTHPIQEVKDQHEDLEKNIENKEFNQYLQQAIDALPQNQKILLVLRDLEGRSYEEIVQITGFKLGTVKSKLSRARDMLKESLKGILP